MLGSGLGSTMRQAVKVVGQYAIVVLKSATDAEHAGL